MIIVIKLKYYQTQSKTTMYDEQNMQEKIVH